MLRESFINPYIETGVGHTKSREGLENLRVTRIYQFTHPGFDVVYRGSGRGEKRTRHKQLEALWQEKLDEISADPGAILFYVSRFAEDVLQLYGKLKKGQKLNIGITTRQDLNLKAPEIEEELRRMIDLKKRLGRRFFFISHSDRDPDKQKKKLKMTLENRSVEIPDDIPIQCFGEYFEACVKHEVKRLGDLLGRSGFNVDNPKHAQRLEDHSLSLLDPESFYRTPPWKSP